MSDYQIFHIIKYNRLLWLNTSTEDLSGSILMVNCNSESWWDWSVLIQGAVTFELCSNGETKEISYAIKTVKKLHVQCTVLVHQWQICLTCYSVYEGERERDQRDLHLGETILLIINKQLFRKRNLCSSVFHSCHKLSLNCPAVLLCPSRYVSASIQLWWNLLPAPLKSFQGGKAFVVKYITVLAELH